MFNNTRQKLDNIGVDVNFNHIETMDRLLEVTQKLEDIETWLEVRSEGEVVTASAVADAFAVRLDQAQAAGQKKLTRDVLHAMVKDAVLDVVRGNKS